MKLAKRIFVFASINILIVVSLSILLSILGVQPHLSSKGLDYGTLITFCLVWGFGGAFISLALSRKMAKWMMGVELVEANSMDGDRSYLVRKVHELSRQAGLPKLPEVGVYESQELNAFATGPTKSRALVAVSSGLLHRMNRSQLDGVLAHEVAHIANGDMVTMTLLQGVMNAFVMFFARIIAWAISQNSREENPQSSQFRVTFILEMVY